MRKIDVRRNAIDVISSIRNCSYVEENAAIFRMSSKVKSASDLLGLRFLACQYIDTLSEEFGCHVNAPVYYWGGEVFFADVRVHEQFNVHAKNGARGVVKMSRLDYATLCERVMSLIKKEKGKLDELARSLEQQLLRLDCLIDLNNHTLRVAEAEVKGGPGRIVRDRIIPSMEARAGV